MADLTIAQAKEKKKELEDTIFDLISTFEQETGIRVSYLSLNRRGDDRWEREEDSKLSSVSANSDYGL